MKTDSGNSHGPLSFSKSGHQTYYMTIPFETHDVEDDLDLHLAVCREIHPFDGCKCPLRDKPGRENSIDVQGADMLYLKTAQHQHEHPACVRTDISLCAFAFLSRVQQMLSRWT